MKYKILNKESLYQGFFKLDAYTVEHECYDGSSFTVRREHLERGDAVAILLHDPSKDEVLLIEQFRIGPAVRTDNPWLLEIVAGMIDEEESPEACVRRECIEESGYTPENIRFLCSYYVSPGGSSERIHLFIGEVDADHPVAPGGGMANEHEDIRILWVKRDTAITWLNQGRIQSGAPMLALLLAFGAGTPENLSSAQVKKQGKANDCSI